MNPQRPELIGDDHGPKPNPTEFESLLQRVPLTRPSAQLDQRIWQLLRAPIHIARIRAAVIGIAAAIILLVGLAMFVHQRVGIKQEATNKTSPVPLVPVVNVSRLLRIERNGAKVADEGIIGFAGRTPLHGYRYESVRQIWYVDPQGRRLCVTIPDQRVVLVPVQPF